MEEENDDDDNNQRSTPDWTDSVMQPEDGEIIGNDDDDDDKNQRSTPDWTDSVMQPEDGEIIGNDDDNNQRSTPDRTNSVMQPEDGEIIGNDDDKNQRLTPDWTDGVMQPEDEENIGHDAFNNADSVMQPEDGEIIGNDDDDDDDNQRSTPDWTDSVMQPEDGEIIGNDAFNNADNAGEENAADLNQDAAYVDGNEHANADADAHVDVDVDVDRHADAHADVDVNRDVEVDIEEGIIPTVDVLADVDINVHRTYEDKDLQDRSLKDLKGKAIATEEDPIVCPATDDDCDDATDCLGNTYKELCQNLPSTSRDAPRALPTSVPSQDVVNRMTSTITPNWSDVEDQVDREAGVDVEHILVHLKRGFTTPDHSFPLLSLFQNANRSVPASTYPQDVDRLHMMNFMENVDMGKMASTPHWNTADELSPQEKQALEDRLNREKEEEKEQARNQYVSGTPDWFTPPTNQERNTNVRMKETLRRDREMHRIEATEGESDMRHSEMVSQKGQFFMYPLPEKDQLLALPIYNTYHHHHIHELRKGNLDGSCPKSTCADPSFHTHTSQHRPMKVEIRLFTFNYESSVVAHFRNNNIRIRITSTQPATYTTLVVTHDWLEFVHHIVHHHDVHVVDARYQDHFNLTSVGSQTCTRTKTQCRLFGSVGNFFHTHYHEFIHTVFVSAPIEEDAMVYSKYLHLGTIHRPNI